MEETNNLFDDCLNKENLFSKMIWNSSGKYACFIMKVPHISLPTNNLNEEKGKLAWIHLADLFDQRAIKGYSDANTFFQSDPKESNKHQNIQIFSFLKTTLRINGVRNLMNNIEF